MDGRAAVGHLTEAYDTLEDPHSRALVAHALGRALLFTGSPAEAAAFAQRVAAELPGELEEDRRALTAFDLMTGFFGVERRGSCGASRPIAPSPPGAPPSARRCWRRRRRCGGSYDGGRPTSAPSSRWPRWRAAS